MRSRATYLSQLRMSDIEPAEVRGLPIMDHSSPPLVRDPVRGRYRYALELSRLEDGMTVVDWGCAQGWFSSQIAERYPAARVIACDIPYPAGRPDFTEPHVEYHVIDETAPGLQVGDQTVDRIFVLDVLEHMGSGSRPAALAEMRRILKEDGLLIVTVPHRGLLAWTDVENVRMRFPLVHRAVFKLVRGGHVYDARYGADPLVNFSADAMDHHHYSEEEICEVLSLAGFAPGERRSFGALYLLPLSLSWLLEALRRVTGSRLDPLERAVMDLLRRTVDAKPPKRLAESLGIAASPAPPDVAGGGQRSRTLTAGREPPTAAGAHTATKARSSHP